MNYFPVLRPPGDQNDTHPYVTHIRDVVLSTLSYRG